MAKANKNLRSELENRIRFESLISDISARFVKLPSSEVDNEIGRALKQILDFFNIDRCGLMGIREDKQFVWLTHICCAEGIETVSKDINLAALFPWCYEKLIIKGEHVLVSRMTELPPEAEQDRLSWAAMGAKSNLTISLFSTQGVRHLLAIQSIQKERDWPQEFIPRLKLLGEIFVNALERRNTDQSLRESEERLNLASDSAGIGLWIIDMHTQQVWVTPKMRELFNFTSYEEIYYESFFKVIHPEDCETVRRAVEQSFQTKEKLRVEHRVVLPDGKMRWISVRGLPYLTSSGEPDRLMGVSIDITGRKRTEETLLASQEELHRLAGKLLTAQEEERRRLAREMHDDLSQRLAALAIETGRLEKETGPKSSGIGNKLKSIREQLIEISADVHDLSRQLHPSIIEDLGLVDAMKSECSLFSKRENIDIQFEQNNAPLRVPRDIAICFYRIFQEALRNIKKHARTNKAEVAIIGSADELVLRIRDQGDGFNLEKMHRKTGVGLASMKERARLIQGKFAVQSEIGAGTTIEVRAPLLEK